MASINKVIIVGNVGKDPEIRFMPNGKGVANFSIATTEKWKDQNGNKQEKTEWHNLVAYEPLSKIIEQYVGKGDPLYVEGKLQTRKWQDKNGGDRYSTEIIVNQLQMLGSRKDGQQTNQPANNGGRNSYEDARNGYSQAPAPTFDDDIPF